MANKRTHRIYGILLSIFTVITGILLILACIGIYHQGDHPFTPETVTTAFATIAVPVYICIALILGGFILDGFFPNEKAKNQAEKNDVLILEKLYEKHGQLQNPAICAEQRCRRILTLSFWGLFVICTALFLVYSLNPGNFDSVDITGSVVKAVYLMIPCTALPFAYSIIVFYLRRRSVRREIAIVKQTVAEGNFETTPAKKAPAFSVKGLRWALLGVAVFLFVFGLFTGGTQDVLTKAVNICTECVGLG